MAMAPAGMAVLLKSFGIDMTEVMQTVGQFQQGLNAFNQKLDLVIAQQGALQQQVNVLARELGAGAANAYTPPVALIKSDAA